MPPLDPAVVAKLADTIPSIAGILAILGVLIPVGLYMARMLRDALSNNTAALDRLRERDDDRTERHFEVLQQLGERCLADHQAASVKLDGLAGDLTAIRDRLGKD
jgi:hypothetical protein